MAALGKMRAGPSVLAWFPTFLSVELAHMASVTGARRRQSAPRERAPGKRSRNRQPRLNKALAAYTAQNGELITVLLREGREHALLSLIEMDVEPPPGALVWTACQVEKVARMFIGATEVAQDLQTLSRL